MLEVCNWPNRSMGCYIKAIIIILNYNFKWLLEHFRIKIERHKSRGQKGIRNHISQSCTITCLLKGTHDENNPFPGIWFIVWGLWCCYTHTNFEISLYMLFWERYAFLKVAYTAYSYQTSKSVSAPPPRKEAYLNIN